MNNRFKYGKILLLDGKYRVKYLGCNFGKALIRSANYQRYVEFDRLSQTKT